MVLDMVMSKRSSALVERACRRIALTELREALGGSARCADQAKKTYSFPCVPQGKTHSLVFKDKVLRFRDKGLWIRVTRC